MEINQSIISINIAIFGTSGPPKAFVPTLTIQKQGTAKRRQQIEQELIE